MSDYCLECGEEGGGRPEYKDPRTPPLDVNECLCKECYGVALEDELETAVCKVGRIGQELSRL